MFHYRRTEPQQETAPDEWNVEDIEKHRTGKDVFPEFLVRWQGSDEKTWQPLRHFFHSYSAPETEYCVSKKVHVPNVLQYLHEHKPEVTIEQVAASTPLATPDPGEEWTEPPAEWTWPIDGTAVDQPEVSGGRGGRRWRIALAPPPPPSTGK